MHSETIYWRDPPVHPFSTLLVLLRAGSAEVYSAKHWMRGGDTPGKSRTVDSRSMNLLCSHSHQWAMKLAPVELKHISSAMEIAALLSRDLEIILMVYNLRITNF